MQEFKLLILLTCVCISYAVCSARNGWFQAYSNGLSEIILGKAIKKLNLPRDEIVVMTKVCVLSYARVRVSYHTLPAVGHCRP
jgi:hypothetical protein